MGYNYFKTYISAVSLNNQLLFVITKSLQKHTFQIFITLSKVYDVYRRMLLNNQRIDQTKPH